MSNVVVVKELAVLEVLQPELAERFALVEDLREMKIKCTRRAMSVSDDAHAMQRTQVLLAHTLNTLSCGIKRGSRTLSMLLWSNTVVVFRIPATMHAVSVSVNACADSEMAVSTHPP